MRITICIVFTGAWSLGVFRIHAQGDMPEGWDWLLWGSIAVAPILGLLLAGALEALINRFTRGPFGGGRGGDVAPTHSIGESLLQHAEYDEAAEWFEHHVEENPGDWRAQRRLIEIVEEHLDDPDRTAAARTRLLKMAEVPEGLWVETAFTLGASLEAVGELDPARNVYKSILWKYPEGPDANEAWERLSRLEHGGT